MERLDTHQISAGLRGTPSKTNITRKKDDQDASKSSDSCIVAHCNLGINEMTSLSSYKDCWLLDTVATSHMTFRKYCFEELNETIDGIVYIADKSSIKPKGMGTIRLKMPGFPDFLLRTFFIFQSCREACCPWWKFDSKAIPSTCLMESLK